MNLPEDLLQRDRDELLELLLAEQGTAADAAMAAIAAAVPPAPVPVREAADRAPLSFGQRRLWLLQQLTPDSALYHLNSVLRVRGPLQVQALGEAVSAVVARHEILRTTFHAGDDGEPVQRIHAARPVALPLEDLSVLPAEQRQAQAARRLAEEADQAFDLERGPLLRLRLMRLADGEHLLQVTAHHLVYDGWSTAVFVRELAALYRAACRGESAVLSPVAQQFADYVAWERAQDFTPQVDYWVRTLGGVPELELPADRPAAAVPSFAGATLPFALSRETTEALRQLGRRHGATLFMTLLAGFQTLLWRYSGQDDFALAVPVANRERAESDGTIGFFVNTLALRARLEAGLSFEELLARTRAGVSEAFAHQAAPFERVVEALAPGRVSLHLPLVRVAFALQNASGGAMALEGLALEPQPVASRWAKFDLTLLLQETADGLAGELEYATDRYDAATAARLLQHLRVLLEAVAAAPRTRIAELPLLSAAEHAELARWNDTARPYPRDESIAQVFARQARATPQAVALDFEDGWLSYQVLDARARRLAWRLRQAGVVAGTPVALHARRSAAMVVGMLAVLQAGGCYVPLDPSYPQERLQGMLQDCAAPVLLASPELGGQFAAHPGLAVIALDEIDTLPTPPGDAVLPVPDVDGAGPAYVIYTSGSTGKPKGVVVPQRAVLRLVLNSDYVSLGAGDRIAQASNASFDAATFEVWGALLNGGCLVGVPQDVVLAPQRLAALLREQGITTLFLTTALFNQIAREAPAAFAPLRELLFGGELVDPQCVREVLRVGAPQRLLHVYGPTENTTFSTWHLVPAVPAGATTVPIGRALANTQLHVLDAQSELVPVGVPGELYLGGDGLALGYLGRPDATADRFVSNPLDGGRTRLYRTGDIVRRLADGALEFIGRRDGQVKIRGFRVELGEIEAALARHPSVREAVVLARQDRPGPRELVAYLAWRADAASPSIAALRQALARELPPHMLPARWVVLPALPINENGKVARQALPAPQDELDAAAAEGAAVEAPQGEREQCIAAVWSEVLGRARIGREDNFFDLGGHSLLATQVVSRLGRALGQEVPLRALFEAPTVAELARRLEVDDAAAADADSAIAPAPAGDAPVLSFAQERLWFLDQLEPGNPFYNVPFALRLRGALDVAALGRSLQAIVARHEVLRTTFPAEEGRPVPRIADAAAAPVALPVTDLAARAPGEREAETRRLVMAEAREPFDLARGPLLRARLLRLGPQEHVLLFSMHHIVADGWSLGVLTGELQALYGAGGDAQAAALPPLPVQYRDFAAWQRQWLTGAVLEAQRAYWVQRLADAPRTIELPTDRPRPAVQSHRGGSVQATMEPTLAEPLRQLGQRHGATPFMTLLAAFATLLHRYSGQTDLVIGSPIANRTRRELEPMIGFFVNTLALRVDLRGNPSFEALLQRVRQSALDAYAHQDLPFERLVDELQPERDLSRNPLFQVMFALQNAPSQGLALPGLSAEAVNVRRQTALFDLVLDLWESDGALLCVLEYNADLYEEATAQRMLGHLRTLLASIAADPARPIDELAWLGADEQQALLALGTGARRRYPVECPLHELIAGQAARHGARIAATHRGRSLSYAELDARANRLARRLQRLGAAPGAFVALLDDRGLDLLTAMVAVLKTGAAFVPIEPTYPSGRIAHMLGDSRAAVLAGSGARLSQLPAGAHAGAVLRLDADDWAQEPAEPPVQHGGARDVAYMLYTSGSTGLPKGAMVRHDGAVNHVFAEAELLGLDQDTALLQSAPSSSDISVWQFLGPLLLGARTVIVDYETVCDPAALHAAIRTEGVTLIELVPAAMKALLDHAALLAPAERALPRLRTAMVTGEATTPALVAQWQSTFPATVLINAYGPTEAADDICQAVLDQPLDPERRVVPIGRPLPNLTLYVLDDQLRLVPPGVRGEICVSGIGVGAGYWNNEARTRAAFVPNPYAADSRGETLYRTGDCGRWNAQGELECLERSDHQVKLRGFRIELGEIEALLATHEAVGQAAVALQGAADGERRLVAAVVADAQSEPVRRELAELQRQQVALWQDLHEDSYRDELTPGDPTFNMIGWDSNYTGQPLPESEMREYVAHTVERIRALGPGRVLEIGCGTGLVMFPLLPHCAAYTGLDLSGVAIGRLQSLQALPALSERIAGLEQARLVCGRADDPGVATGSMDTVALPSVVQYFPSVDYLLQVLDHLFTQVLAPGGAIFIGDVRSLPLMEAFHASVQLYKAAPGDSAAVLARRVRQRLAQEQELALDPAFFEALRRRHPSIAEVQVLPKRGTRHNEMTRFRYDVLIRTVATAGVVPVPQAVASWEDWRRERPDVEALRRRVLAQPGATLALRRIANPRTAEGLQAAEALLRGRPDAQADGLRAQICSMAPTGLEPEALWQLGRELGLQVDLSLAAGYADGSYDAVLRPLPDAGAALPPPAWRDADSLPRPWRRYGSEPLQEKLGRRLAPVLREFLASRLPAYMVPSAFMLLPALPQTPAGKVDRSALPVPALDESPAALDPSAKPRDAEEAALVAIWADVLGVAAVGIHDNFFDLGGHSLKATQVMSRIQREHGVEVALRELFAHPSVAELAPVLRAARGAQGTPGVRASAIPKAPPAGHYPLSAGQRRLWVLSRLEGASSAYNMPLALLFEGMLDAQAFNGAWAQLVERHETLRTVFTVVDQVPRQRVLPPGAVALQQRDLRGEPDPEGAARRLALQEAATPFDLEHGVARAQLLRLNEQRHVLLLTLHHIASDDWSQGVMAREFVALYTRLHEDGAAAPAPLALQYRDYACWQNEYLAGDAARAHRDYWHARLAAPLPVLDLATDLPRPAQRTRVGHTVGLRLDARQAAGLKALARARRGSLFMVLVALVDALLHRCCGQDDLVIGFPIAGRDHPDLEEQVGFYVNMLPLRVQLDGEAPFTTLLDRVRDTATEAYEHQAYPFDRLVDELPIPRDVGRSPMFDVVVVMQNASAPVAAPAGLRVSPFVTEYALAKYDLSFTFQEDAQGLQADLCYAADLFVAERMERMAGHLRTLVDSVLADPATPVARLPMLTAGERRALLACPQPPAPPRAEDSLVARFEQQARCAPGRIALVWPETSADIAPAEAGPRRTLSYGELNEQADRLAARLRALGAGRDQCVGVCLPRSLELIVALLGVLKAGAGYLPLDGSLPAERRAFMLGDAGARVVVTRAALAGEFAGAGVATLCLDAPLAQDEGAAPPKAADASAPCAADLAYVIFTSGSTGRPKGVAVTHANVLRLFDSTQTLFGFGDDEVWTLFHSYAFDFSVWELWGALLYGGQLVVVPQAVSRAPEAFLALLEREGVTVLNQTPSAFRQLVLADADAPGRALALRHVVFGGEALDLPSLRPWFERHGDQQPRLVNMYGITETTVHVTFRALSAADLERPGSRIGQPLADLWLRLLDRHGEPVPVGVAGEIHVGGAGVARGYLNRPELNAERFIADPFAAPVDRVPARLYRAGDLARRLADGDIEYLGRIDQQVQIRGFRVEPGEVEALLAAHPEVREAAVLPHGEGAQLQLRAYVVPAPGAPAPAPAALRRHLQARLPDYMVPAGFVTVARLPLTSNGKLDRAALLALAADAPAASAAPLLPPQGALETLVAGLFEQTVGAGPVGRDQNFFDAGANSLLLVQLQRELRAALDREVPALWLFQYPTVATLAAHLADAPAPSMVGAAALGVASTPTATPGRDRAEQRRQAREARRRPAPGSAPAAAAFSDTPAAAPASDSIDPASPRDLT